MWTVRATLPPVSSGGYTELHPDARTLGDAEMLLMGAYAPQQTFGGAVALDEHIAAMARSAGGVVLTDNEGAPVAAVSASGAVSGLAAPASGPFRSLQARPADIAVSGPHRGVLLHRPLLAPEVSALAEIGEEHSVLLLVRTVGSLVPADVLVRSTLAAATQMPGARVATVPFAPRDDASVDATLAERVLASFGATAADVLENDSEWYAARGALDAGDGDAAAERLDPATLAVLQRWRPPRDRRGLVVFFTGLSGSGKSTVARGLVDRLHETDRSVTVLDGDVARRMLSSGLGFSRDDRDTNIRRLGWVGAEVARHGGVAVLAPIAPFASTRAEVRRMVQATGDLVLVWISTPLAECELRDRKGLYARARSGEIADFTGISSPYEEPDDADLVLDTSTMSVDEAVAKVWTHLQAGGWLPAEVP
jgi:sulfate adenylyltransferase